MKTKKAIIFDFDGTLADSLPVLLESYNAIAPKFRLRRVSVDEVNTLRKLSYREMFKSVNLRPFITPMVVRAGTRELKKRQHSVKLFSGIPELLADLAKEYQVGILTSNESSVVESVLRENGVDGLDFIVSHRSLFSKHKAFKRIEKSHGLLPDEILYVGDEYRDVIACRKAGVTVVGVTWGLGGREAFIREPADKIVDTVSDLKKVIRSLA